MTLGWLEYLAHLQTLQGPDVLRRYRQSFRESDSDWVRKWEGSFPSFAK